MKKTVAILGLGKYGESLAQYMYKMGSDVLIVDINEEKLKELSSSCTSAIRADLTNEDEVLALGLKNMDVVVVAMSGNLAASIMSVSVANEQNVPVIVAKSNSDRMTSILKKIGADKIIVPERLGARQSAMILSSDNFLDYFEVDENLCMVEMNPLARWVGKNIIDLDLRKKYKVNVVAIKSGVNWVVIDPKKPLKKDDELLIVVEQSELRKIKG